MFSFILLASVYLCYVAVVFVVVCCFDCLFVLFLLECFSYLCYVSVCLFFVLGLFLFLNMFWGVYVCVRLSFLLVCVFACFLLFCCSVLFDCVSVVFSWLLIVSLLCVGLLVFLF